MADRAENRFVEIGRIGRARGLNGWVRFMPNDAFTDDLFERITVFFMRNERSDLIPARIDSVQVENKRNQQLFFVKFDTIATRSDADAAMNKALFTEKDQIGNQQPETGREEDSLTGYSVHFGGKVVGRVLDVLENPAHPIIEVKTETGSLLIPCVDEYVERVSNETDTLYCRNLDQLTDL